MLKLAEQKGGVTRRSKHVDIRFFSVRDEIQNVCFCPTLLNVSDAMTKPMSYTKFLLFPGLLMGNASEPTEADANFVSIFEFFC